MEKVETKIRQVEDRTHYFYCNDCGALLGTSHEYNDGWYEEVGKFELKWFTPDGWYKLEKYLCTSCKNKFLTRVYDTLEFAGFERD